MTHIKWQNPPERTNSTTKWDEVAKALRSRPGDWALIKERKPDSGLFMAIKAGHGRWAATDGHYEARTVSVEGGRDTYARFVGEQ